MFCRNVWVQPDPLKWGWSGEGKFSHNLSRILAHPTNFFLYFFFKVKRKFYYEKTTWMIVRLTFPLPSPPWQSPPPLPPSCRPSRRSSPPPSPACPPDGSRLRRLRRPPLLVGARWRSGRGWRPQQPPLRPTLDLARRWPGWPERAPGACTSWSGSEKLGQAEWETGWELKKKTELHLGREEMRIWEWEKERRGKKKNGKYW